MIRKATCLFASFPGVGPSILSRLFQSYCLSLYGSCLWSLSSPAIHNIEVAFSKILHKIWHFHYQSRTAIVHLIANLPSLYIVVFHRSNSLCIAASKCPSTLVRVIFRDSAAVSYSFCGYNFLYGPSHLKVYDSQSQICADVIWSIRCSCTDHTFDEMIDSISCD